ncbi:acyl carrier protein [Streptomyces sp. M41]|uniref:acyl carrier protein n=1 Tax=Streptomyces sp. M41 TaxID=3059412 RepID=UPI00374CFEA1
MATTLDTITEVLTQTFPIDAADITPERTFEDLGLDSLALLEMGLAVQESTGITLNDTELPKTVGQLVTLLDAARAHVEDAGAGHAGAGHAEVGHAEVGHSDTAPSAATPPQARTAALSAADTDA